MWTVHYQFWLQTSCAVVGMWEAACIWCRALVWAGLVWVQIATATPCLAPVTAKGGWHLPAAYLMMSESRPNDTGYSVRSLLKVGCLQCTSTPVKARRILTHVGESPTLFSREPSSEFVHTCGILCSVSQHGAAAWWHPMFCFTAWGGSLWCWALFSTKPVLFQR